MVGTRTPHEKGKEVEDIVAKMLERLGAAYIRNKKCESPFGPWDIDFYVTTSPPVLISCKNPTGEAQQPGGSVRKKAHEAWFQLTGLIRFCHEVPPDSRLVLVTGALPLRTRGRDYEAILAHLLGGRLSVGRTSDLDTLEKVLKAAMTREGAQPP